MADQPDENAKEPTENQPTSEPETESSEEPTLSENMRAGDTWMRGFYVLLFLIIFGLAKTLLIAMVIFQFLSTLFVHRTNRRLVTFAGSLCAFIYEVASYLSYASDERPFPFKEWPKSANAKQEA